MLRLVVQDQLPNHDDDERSTGRMGWDEGNAWLGASFQHFIHGRGAATEEHPEQEGGQGEKREKGERDGLR
jgi:hypothetical protein